MIDSAIWDDILRQLLTTALFQLPLGKSSTLPL